MLLTFGAATVATGKSGLAGTAVPPGFVGVDTAGSPLFTGMLNDRHQFKRMVASGVESIRVGFRWDAAQPYSSWRDVPRGQRKRFQSGARDVPTDFTATDQIVSEAAARGITVLPIVLGAPRWDASVRSYGFATPKDPRKYADYLTTLVRRYGPHGSFWTGHPGIRPVPIRMWQIWNEENLSFYWPQPFVHHVRKYVALLRAAHAAIKRADPGAKAVLGALTNYSWKDLAHIEHVRGARRLFDVIAVNNFTAKVDQAIFILELVRKAADDNGDPRKPMIATELSWPSAKGKTPQRYGWITTEAGQARNIAELLPKLAAARVQLRLAGFDYFNWMGVEHRGARAFRFAGLLRYEARNRRVVAKPALSAFRRAALAIEGCRRKGTTATRCLQRG